MVTPSSRPPLRLWPGVVLVIVQWFMWFVLPPIAPGALMVASIGGLGAGVAVIAWWLFFSRAPWPDRLGAIALLVVAVAATRPLLHKSIQTGINGMMYFFYVIPGLTLALVATAAMGRRMSVPARRITMAAGILLACAVWTLMRTDGISVGHVPLVARWTTTAEERLLAQVPSAPETATPVPVDPAEVVTVEKPPEPIAAALDVAPVEWPGFRGPSRDSVVRGVRIATDWSASPPVQVWRRPIGPGWSSFAVSGDLLYTQEQRGDDEIVACYRVSSGAPVWMHRDEARFWEANAGPGPRATPAIGNGRVYTFGATGILNAFVAGSGALVWSRNAASDTGATTPIWGFASSPLVVADVVIIAAGGTLAAYDARTGAPRWTGPRHSGNYSSPHFVTIDGVAQVLLLSPPGVTSVAPADGRVLWEHTWEGGAIVQPAMTADGDLLITALGGPGGLGTRRLAISRGSGSRSPDSGADVWTVTERWTSNGLKPYFNDFVVHDGHAYGFDGNILASIRLDDGKRAWKGGRYGYGQLLLLAEQDLLLVLSEEGELVLVSARPDAHTEIARFQALDGKTWNHPVIVGDILLVRNGEEMAAFRLALLDR